MTEPRIVDHCRNLLQGTDYIVVEDALLALRAGDYHKPDTCSPLDCQIPAHTIYRLQGALARVIRYARPIRKMEVLSGDELLDELDKADTLLHHLRDEL